MNFDQYIQIYKRDRTRNDYNEWVESLALLVSVPANVNYKGGREGMYARQVVATGEVTFGIRFYPGIDETMVVKYNDRMHEIRNIEPVGRREKLLLHTRYSDNASLPNVT